MAPLLKGLLASGATFSISALCRRLCSITRPCILRPTAGVMITGSHNPPEYNGFKTVCGSGTMHGEQIQEILKLIEGSDFATRRRHAQEVDAVTPYVDEIASQFQFPRRVKVVLDAGNGTAGR